MTTDSSYEVIHDRDLSQFYIDLGNQQRAVIDYRLVDDAYAITHTGVPPAFRGRGIADRLAGYALDTAAAEGRKVIPLCSFIQTYIRRHKEYAPLLRDA